MTSTENSQSASIRPDDPVYVRRFRDSMHLVGSPSRPDYLKITHAEWTRDKPAGSGWCAISPNDFDQLQRLAKGAVLSEPVENAVATVLQRLDIDLTRYATGHWRVPADVLLTLMPAGTAPCEAWPTPLDRHPLAVAVALGEVDPQ